MRTLVVAALIALGGSSIAHLPCCNAKIQTVVCQPGVWCDIELPADDVIDKQRPPIADETQWGVAPQAGDPAHVFVKPVTSTAPRTLLTIPMQLRTYHVWLVASTTAQHVVYQIAPPPTPPPAPPTPLPTATPAPDLHLSGSYRVTGRAPFSVTRIGTDGVRTFIFLPRLQSYPAAEVFDDFGRQQQVSYAVHVLRDLSREYIIPGVWGHIELTLGGGKHTVFLRYDRVQ